MRGQERADSLKSVVFAFVLGGCPGFAVVRFRLFRHKNLHVDGHIVPGWPFFSVCGDGVCVKTRLRPQERADSRASNCVCGLFVCVCGVVRFLGFYNGFLAFF